MYAPPRVRLEQLRLPLLLRRRPCHLRRRGLLRRFFRPHLGKRLERVRSVHSQVVHMYSMLPLHQRRCFAGGEERRESKPRPAHLSTPPAHARARPSGLPMSGVYVHWCLCSASRFRLASLRDPDSFAPGEADAGKKARGLCLSDQARQFRQGCHDLHKVFERLLLRQAGRARDLKRPQTQYERPKTPYNIL